MIFLEDAQDYLLNKIRPLEALSVPLSEAAGLVLSETAHALELVPPFANTAMDGFAVRAADTVNAPVTLKVTGAIAAGDYASKSLATGQAMQIMTGAPLPPGADAVVMVERTKFDPLKQEVEVQITVAEGNHVRQAGEDVQPGDQLCAAGTLLGAGHLGVLASVGFDTVRAFRRPRVGVISTGDELVDDGSPLKLGQIRDSNRRTLLTLVAESGMVPLDLGIIRDNEADLTRAFTNAAGSCDAIVSSGGVSMGEFDFVKVVLDRLGEMRWMQIAIKPAKPFAFGLIGQTPVFGLPGNPVSSMVSYELLARPALLKMAGQQCIHRPRRLAVSTDTLGGHDDGKTHFLRVCGTPDETGRWRVGKLGGQGSHQLTAMAQANALAVVPAGQEITPGDEVEIILLGTVMQ